MDPGLYAELTEGQKDCLRLIHQRYQIKEIAAELGIHQSSVNERLKRARHTLGVNTSVEAARLLADHEQALGTWIPPTGSANTMSSGPSPLAEEGDDSGVEASDRHLGDSISPGAYSAPELPIGRRGIRWPFPTRGRTDNDLSIGGRIAWVPACAAISLIAILLIAVLTIGLQDVMGEIFRRALHRE